MPEVRVCKKGDIAEGGTRLVKNGPVEIGVIFHNGAYYAYRNQCPHQGGPACEGLKMPQVVEKIGDKGINLGQDFGMGELGYVPATFDFRAKDVRQAVEQVLFAALADERILIAAHQQNRLADLRQNGP